MARSILSGLTSRLLKQTNLTQESVSNGQTFVQSALQNIEVVGAPAFVLANDFVRLLNFGRIQTEGAEAAVLVTGQNADIVNFRSGIIDADNGEAATASGIEVTGSANIRNFGTIDGETNGVSFAGPQSSGLLDNLRGGTISSNSRAVDIQGNGVQVRNFGDILGTGDQRNGTVYTNGSSDNFSIRNSTSATIDAGEGNQGSGISLEIGDEIGESVSGLITNGVNAVIQGRGQAASNTTLAGDGIVIRAGAEGTIFEGSIRNSGLINSESRQGTTAGIRVADGVGFNGTIANTRTGTISGEQNGLYFGNGEHNVNVLNEGTISSGSRAVNIDGSGVNISNSGNILGTGDQRNGTVYADDTASDFSINNESLGVIDAGRANNGAGISLSLDLDGPGAATSINNAGVIVGRGQAAANLATAGDGIRLEGVRVADGFEDALFEGTITNSGRVVSLSTQGTTGAFRSVDGVGFQGTLTNEIGGVFSGLQNGVYFGDGDHTGGVVNNLGTIVSNSRAFNIDGVGLTLNNSGRIVGRDDQRNGTVYADGTADDFTVNNLQGGVIDAGSGNQGSGFGAEIGGALDGANTFSLNNEGTIAGRGNAAAGTNAAGDGVRIGNPGNTGVAQATITNSGTITSEGANGTVAGIRFVDGVALDGTLTNEIGGVISGVQNGVYFGNADHSGGVVNNLGTISSGSRAFNVDGIGLTVNNDGVIIGTGDQRNGTFYADDTAESYVLNNSGTIDAGEGNQGAAVSLSLDADGPGEGTAINNSGTIQGRAVSGTPLAPTSPLAGDGLRLEGVRGVNAEGGVTFAPALFDGEIVNSGTISSGDNVTGSTAGFHAVNGVSFQGTLTNEIGGVISGSANGVYFGNPVLGGGSDHTGGVVNNLGTISSDSRAFNLDGIGLTVNNSGTILGTGNQRNGTFYADGTADQYTLNNTGIIDAGLGNNGSGVSLQTGDVDFDVVSASIVNSGEIIGRGNAEVGNQVGDGVRLFSEQSGVTFAGNIENSGIISGSEDSEEAAGISIESGISLDGAIINNGTINGSVNAIDAREAGDVNIVNAGEINGNILLGDGDDTVISDLGIINGVVNGGAGDDTIITGAEDNILIGGAGSDTLIGGDGIDTADFSDLQGPLVLNLEEGIVIDNVGFDADVAKQPLINPNLGISNDLAPAQIVSEAIAGNIYFNVHTTEFPSGEIRGQLEFVSDVTEDGLRVVTLTSVLNGAQEVPAPTDSPAIGEATVTFRLDASGQVVSYETDLSVSGLVGELLPVNIGNGTLSPIHLHNAPIGVNGPVVVDVATDAGEGLVINADIDQLVEIENVILGNGDDLALASELSFINGIIDGGEGIDTVDFSGFFNDGVVVDLEGNAPEGPRFVNFENVIGTDFNDVIAGNAEINVLTGGEGEDFFVFDTGNGDDVVTDFEDGLDLLDVSGRGVNFDLSATINGAQQIENDTLIDLGAGDSVLLQNFLLADLDANDFLVADDVAPIAAPVAAEEPVFFEDGILAQEDGGDLLRGVNEFDISGDEAAEIAAVLAEAETAFNQDDAFSL